MADVAINVEDVSKRFRIYHERNQSVKSAVMRRGRARFEEFWALRDVDLEIPYGKTYGLVGHNGSGKSTLLKCLARILVPDKGRVVANGRISALLELGAGFHPELSGRDNVYLNGSILGLSRRDIDARFDDIVEFAGLEQFIDTPVKNYSSGMYVRLGFSVAINVEPDILLVDEVLAVGDEAFQRRSAAKFDQFRDEGRTIVVVSHALGSVRNMCDEVAWLDHGRVLEVGPADAVVGKYADATTQTPTEPAHVHPSDVRMTGLTALVDGRPVQELAVGSPIDLRLEWQADRAVAGLLLAVQLRTSDGMLIGTARSDALGPLTLGPGTGAVDLHLESWPTAAGTYVLDAVVLEQGEPERELDRLSDAARLAVVAEGARGHEGLILLGGSWS
ncbi:ABC transporter ATP-binding protein [Cellulomonas avistercoris]|nr:ABC transporter ATP-binding protein [Cellulomonas avistercoris]